MERNAELLTEFARPQGLYSAEGTLLPGFFADRGGICRNIGRFLREPAKALGNGSAVADRRVPMRSETYR